MDIFAVMKRSYGNDVQWHDGGIVAQDSLSAVANHAKLLHLAIPSLPST